jgi:hypothetical protein
MRVHQPSTGIDSIFLQTHHEALKFINGQQKLKPRGGILAGVRLLSTLSTKPEFYVLLTH